jgi:hypothetical protein
LHFSFSITRFPSSSCFLPSLLFWFSASRMISGGPWSIGHGDFSLSFPFLTCPSAAGYCCCCCCCCCWAAASCPPSLLENQNGIGISSLRLIRAGERAPRGLPPLRFVSYHMCRACIIDAGRGGLIAPPRPEIDSSLSVCSYIYRSSCLSWTCATGRLLPVESKVVSN